MMHRNATNCTPMHISHAASHRQHFWMRHSGWQLTDSSWWSTDKAGNGQQMVVNRPTAGGWLVMAGRRRGGRPQRQSLRLWMLQQQERDPVTNAVSARQTACWPPGDTVKSTEKPGNMMFWVDPFGRDTCPATPGAPRASESCRLHFLLPAAPGSRSCRTSLAVMRRSAPPGSAPRHKRRMWGGLASVNQSIRQRGARMNGATSVRR